MKLTRLIPLTGLLTCAAAMAQAQERTPSEAATAEQRLAEDVGLERLSSAFPPSTNFRNVLTLQQSGRNNTTTISQQNPTLISNEAILIQAGDGNTLGINQIGGNNRFSADQTGINNTVGFTQNGRHNTTVITQDGASNTLQGVGGNSDFLLEGNDNTMKITQQGNNNLIKGEVRENSRNYDIKQYGNNHTLTQIESTQRTPTGYSVEMRGQGIKITIEQSQVLPGVR